MLNELSKASEASLGGRKMDFRPPQQDRGVWGYRAYLQAGSFHHRRVTDRGQRVGDRVCHASVRPGTLPTPLYLVHLNFQGSLGTICQVHIYKCQNLIIGLRKCAPLFIRELCRRGSIITPVKIHQTAVA